jgi:predicted porin
MKNISIFTILYFISNHAYAQQEPTYNFYFNPKDKKGIESKQIQTKPTDGQVKHENKASSAPASAEDSITSTSIFFELNSSKYSLEGKENDVNSNGSRRYQDGFKIGLKRQIGAFAIGINYQQFKSKFENDSQSVDGDMHGLGVLASFEHSLFLLPLRLTHTLEYSVAQNQNEKYSSYLEGMKMKSVSYSVGPEFRIGKMGIQVGAQYSHRETKEILNTHYGIANKQKYQDFGPFARLSIYI